MKAEKGLGEKLMNYIVAIVAFVLGAACTQVYYLSGMQELSVATPTKIPCAEMKKEGCWDDVTFGMVSDALDKMPSKTWVLYISPSQSESYNWEALSESLNECVSYKQRAFGAYHINESAYTVIVEAPTTVLDECVTPLILAENTKNHGFNN
jgi:hypothetical protein